jgi:ATP synthase protein I
VAKHDGDRGNNRPEEDEPQDPRSEEERREDARRAREGEVLKARLDKLSDALDAQRKAQNVQREEGAGQGGPSIASVGGAMSLGFRVLSEFVAAVVVGALIGWWIDGAAGTSPAFLLIFLLIGTGAGFWNVYRIATKSTGSQGG